MPLDTSTFEHFYKSHFKGLCQYAYSFCKDASQAQELAQQVCIQIWEQRHRIEKLTSSYAYASVKNAALNWIRDQKSEAKKIDAYQLYTELDHEQTDSTLPDLDWQVLLQSLPDRCRDIFQLKRLEGKSYREIATLMNITEKTVENQMGIALKKLREAALEQVNSLGENETKVL